MPDFSRFAATLVLAVVLSPLLAVGAAALIALITR